MDSLQKLNSYSEGFRKVADLEQNKLYRVKKMRTINTKYGLSILVNLDDFGDVILPSRFRAILVNLDDFGDVILPSRFRELAETIEEFNKMFTQNNVFLKAGQPVGKYIPIEFVQH
ncbi:hypothetical protein QE152_g10684 [Popillia japonica]|uniref:Uncharacterized protein n=1 Tax=Popillia japonica TaxID=7064 RepID=A0AAW1LQE1_POPJA